MKFALRIIADVLILIGVFVAPWWLTLVLIGLSIFLFRNFYEAFIFALLLDGFHGVAGQTFFGTSAFFSAIIAAIFLVAIFLKNRLKFY